MYKPDGLPDGTDPSQRIRSVECPGCRRAVVLAPIVLTACQPAVLDPQGLVGIADKTILIDSLAIMLAIVVPTIAATLAFAWWFRASNTRATLPAGLGLFRPHRAHRLGHSAAGRSCCWAAWPGSDRTTSIPHKPLASDTPPLEVQGVSLDWKWLFIYPDQRVASVNQLVVPAGVPIHFSLTSASVMNAFFIPQLGSMIYTMNGMTTQLNLQADAPGTFRGLSSHYSGDGFSDMHFDVRAVPAEQFAAWIEATRNTGPTLDAASYAALAKQSLNAHAVHLPRGRSRAVPADRHAETAAGTWAARPAGPIASVSPRTEH